MTGGGGGMGWAEGDGRWRRGMELAVFCRKRGGCYDEIRNEGIAFFLIFGFFFRMIWWFFDFFAAGGRFFFFRG